MSKKRKKRCKPQMKKVSELKMKLWERLYRQADRLCNRVGPFPFTELCNGGCGRKAGDSLFCFFCDAHCDSVPPEEHEPDCEYKLLQDTLKAVNALNNQEARFK